MIISPTPAIDLDLTLLILFNFNILHASFVYVFVSSCVLVVDVDEAPPRPPEDPDHPHLTDRLLNKCQEKEQTNCDVQIGDGMDIVIVGENGETDICVSISFEILEINFCR